MKKNFVFFIMLISLHCMCWICQAGSISEVFCTNCSFKVEIHMGPNMRGDVKPVYCIKCKRLYHYRWPGKPDGSGETSENIIYLKPLEIKVWNFKDNSYNLMYKCPKCDNLCLAIELASDIKYCPECHQKTIKSHGIAWTD